MSELINIITSKPDWSNKINDTTIVKKWSKELQKQQINKTILQLVIELLKDSTHSEEYDDSDIYKWVVELGVHPNEFSIAKECDCKCDICQFNENNDSECKQSDPFEGECTCTKSKLNKKKRIFMRKFMSKNSTLIDPSTKELFKYNSKKLEKSTPVDYHPGTNNQVIDLLHPFLYCYVKGVTKTKIPPNDKILFQWLPTNFTIGNKKVSIDSYINNLAYADNSALYESIATIFESFVPKFNKVMQLLHENKRTKTFKKLSNCQVIVKLANTILTPQSPKFPKGTWHLEGLANEKIIATGIYYYEMTNITSNYLKFRSTVTDSSDIDYPQDCVEYVKTHYGLDEKDAGYRSHECLVNLGRVQTTEDMCLVFPNFMQHQVSEFELIDKTKMGTRKILVFFLIDPSTEILSTADVLPQQGQMPVADARMFRELLMFQRKYEMKDQNSFFERTWSLCEH